MEIKQRYPIPGFELGPEAKRAYQEGIKKLEDCEDPRKRLEILSGIFEALGKSTYQSNRSIEWAEEIIKAYRNLGEIVGGLSDDSPTQYSGLEERVADFEKKF